jgi:hypothetical protein
MEGEVPVGVPARPPAEVLAEADWTARRAAHERRVDGWITPWLAGRARGDKHPVEDFLFEYYSYSPAKLRRWHPGAGVVLAGSAAGAYRALPAYTDRPGGVGVDPALLPERRRREFAAVRDLLAATAARPAYFGCFGMHEWAMVYRSPQVRHPAWPLRLGRDGTAAVLEAGQVRCSHFDAFRFFTEPARPLNQLQPTRASQPELEQGGCLHANMDLYKWAYRLVPLVDSDLVADCFALAREIRALDMRASPYDLSALGYPPVPVETPAGRQEYTRRQRDFAARATALRTRLLAACDRVEAR